MSQVQLCVLYQGAVRELVTLARVDCLLVCFVAQNRAAIHACFESAGVMSDTEDEADLPTNITEGGRGAPPYLLTSHLDGVSAFLHVKALNLCKEAWF